MSVVKAGVLEGSSDSEEEVHVYKLKIHDTDVKDAGEWRVEVADKYGSTSTACNLAIRDDPKPKPSVTYAGKVSDKGDNSEDEEVHLYKLRIHDAKAEDAGRWRCEVEDKYGSASSSCNLMLDPYNRPSRPKFVTYLKDQKVEEGFSVKFQCVVTGNPVPRIEWYKDMEPVSKSSFVYTSYRGDGTASLQLFSPVADRDNGTYRCVARNSEGSSYSEAILTIHKQITNADLRDQFSISRARTRNEDLANFTGHHVSKFQTAERMMLKSDQYTFETSPHLKKSELYHLDTQFKGHRKSDLYSSTGGRRAKKYEIPDWEEETFDKRSSYNIENDYSPRKRYGDEYKIDSKGKSDVYNFENDYKIKSKSDLYNTDYMYGGKRDILDEMDYQRKLESKKTYDSLTSKRSFDKGFDKSPYSIDIESKYIPRRRELSKEINPGLSSRAKELSRGRSAGSAIDIGRSKSVSLGRDVSSRLVLDDKKGYYTLRPRPKSVSLSRDPPLYDNRAKSMSVARDFGIKSGYESDKEDMYGAPRFRPKSSSFSRELDSPRRTRSASVARDFAVKPETKFKDEHIYNKRDGRARSMSLSHETDELIRNLRESSVGRSEFADIEAYRAELHNKQTEDKSKKSTTCKKKQRGKELKYQTFTKHFSDENKPIKEINPGLSMKAREIVNRQGYRYKVDRDLLNISMSRNRNKSRQTEDSEEDEPIVNGYRKPIETRKPKSDEEEELSNEAFKRKTYLQNLDRFINRANQSFYDIEDSEVPSWRKEKLQDTGYDYTSHMARKNKIELFDFDDIRTSKVALRRDQQPRRAQSVGPELEPPKSKSANTRYNKERQALLNLGTNWVKDKPLAFIERLKSKSVLEGNSVLLSCFVTGKEPFVVLWYRRGIPLSRDEEENFHIRSNAGFLSLEIPVASTYDTGEYVVEVRNEEGKIKSSCYLQVEPIFDSRVEYKQPEFIEQIHHVHAKVGQAATFTCRVKGTPNPFVRWFKDGIELQQTDRINIHQGEKGQAFLLIHDTVEQDTGLYKCEAQSMAGRCRSTAKLQILESMADAFDDVSCNMEVERIISQTKFAKGEVGEVSIQKPKAWRASLETTPATATAEPLTTQKETLKAEKQSGVKESPLKASEILTVLDETLKAAPLEMIPDPSASLAPLTGSDKETSFTSSSTDTPVQAHSIPLALSSENDTLLAISANQSSNNIEQVDDLTARQLDNIQSMNEEDGQGTVLSNSDQDIANKNNKATNQCQDTTDKVAEVTTTQLSINQEGQGTVLSNSVQDIASQSQNKKEDVANLTTPQLESIQPMSQKGQDTVLSSSDQATANVNKENQEFLGDSIELSSFNNDKKTNVSSEVNESPKEIAYETKAQFVSATDSNLPSLDTVLKSDIDDINAVHDTGINSAPSSDAKNVGAIVSADDIKSDMRQEVTSPLQISSERNRDKMEALPSKDNLVGIKESEQLLDLSVSKSIDLVDQKNSSELSGDNIDAKIDIEVPKETQRADSNAIVQADIADKTASDVNEYIPESSKQLNEAALPPVPCNLENVDTLSTAHATLVDKECDLSLTQTNDTNALSELTTAQKVKQEKSTDNNFEMITPKTIKEQNAENPIQSESVAQHDKDVDSIPATAQRVSSPIEKKVKPTEQDAAAETSKTQEITPENKPESTKPAEDIPHTDAIDGKNVATAAGDEVTVTEVKETTTIKSEQTQAKKTDVTEVGERKVKQQKEAPIDEVSVETEKSKGVTETPVQAEKKEDITDGYAKAEKKEDVRDGSSKAEKNEDVKEESLTTVAALAEKEESVPKEEEREPQPPTFVKKLPEKMDLKDGEDLLLQCITDGLPKPDVLWLHEKKAVEASQNVIIKDSHDVHTLEIKKVSHQVHSGSYTAKLIGGSGTSEEEDMVSSCKVFILSKPPAEQKTVMTEENIQDKDIIPVVERQISTDQEELKLQIPASVDLQEVCEEGRSDPDKMHIPMVSPTGVQCHSSPLDKASKEEELPPSQTSPHFTQPLDEELYPLERDENVRIQCVVAGEPCPKIVWFKDGEKLEPSSRIRLEWDPDTRIASVLLKRLHILDTGEYECIVYGENGSYSTKTTLHVKALEMQKVETIDRDDPPESVPPKFFLSLKDKKVFQGKGTTLDCVIKGVPEPTVKWLRHGKEIFPRSGKYLLTAINQQYSLTIEDFKKSDEGCYTVEAINDSGTCSSSAYLTMEAVVAEVEKAPLENSPPEFTSKMEGLMVPVGGVVTFKCSASGYPVPKFKWQKDLLDVYQSKRITIENTPGETTLTISDVTRRDGGMYVCVAKNTLGRNKQTVKLIVSDDCRETRRLSISGEIDRPDEQSISKSDSSNEMNDAVATETNPNEVEEQKLIEEKKDTGYEKVEQTTVSQQQEEANTPEKEEPVVAEDASQPENQPLSEEISQTKEAMTEESGKISKVKEVSPTEEQKEVKEVAAKDVEKKSDTLDAKTEIDQKVEVQESQPTVQEAESLKEEKGDDSRITEGKAAAAVEEEPVQVSEDKIASSLKTVGSEAEVSLMENIDFASVENASLIQKEQKLAEKSTVENVEVQKDETDSQILKSEKKTAEETMASAKIDDQEKAKQVIEKVSSTEENGIDSKTTKSSESLKIEKDTVADTEKCSDIETSTSSASSSSEEGIVQKSVQTAQSTSTMKTVTEDVELDIDHLVEQAETILGESVSSKSEVQDMSFEEVLAKSVLEESVAEAAGEMEKINKTKKRRLSKTKRRSMSLESEEVTDENDAAERTATPSKELETGAATEVTESTTKKEVSTSQRSTKTKSVSFEETVETSGSSDAVDSSSKTSSKTSSKATVSESFTESSASVVEESVKIKSAKKMSVSEKETTSESTTAVKTEKREIRALDRMMSMEDVKDILDVDTLKMNETREAIVEQKTASGKTQVLEVSARRVSKQLSVEEQAKVATHRLHLHHPPEIIVPPENQFVSLHSEIELTVKVRAAHGAKISWYHDGQQVAVTEKALKEIYGEHYELMDEEIPEDK
ncbi:muscle M-line assembly protein unc-89 isoform X1 [Magallana gigas]|uniref:muscle M-line assembly protein unc-89 isoform X1 n=1 Tax=Magallana gigas TaxID=29159 RepID=UPI003341118B